MVTEKKAKSIGSTSALKAACIGIVIAQLIMILFFGNGDFVESFFWFDDISYSLNLIIGIFMMFFSGYLYGQKAGIEILIRKNDYTWVGAKYGFLTLVTTALLSGWTGFFQDLFQNSYSIDEKADIDWTYIAAPFFWISVFGLIPSILVGLWFGNQIKKHDKRE